MVKLLRFTVAKRVESPSSINTFKQCKRKYYYQYVEKLPTLSNIHQVRGNIAHSTLEHFYDIDVTEWTQDNYPRKIQQIIQQLLMHQWNTYKPKLDELHLKPDQEKFYFEETMMMLMNWAKHFTEDLRVKLQKNGTNIPEAFMELTPVREQEFRSDNYSVRGFIDAIQHLDDEVHIIDYKTNSKFDFKDSIKLQLAIYSLLYHEKHGKLPSKVGIFFLRHKLKMMDVDPELLELAKQELELIHAHTSLTEEKFDYEKTITGLCKWSTGKCDFYDVCQPHKK
ncbi:MAG: PD-(D/E)XK nuclease family protein [Candidatus Woesearchaeota archaeon]